MLFSRSTAPFVAYLVTTFKDSQTGIFQYLSNGNDAYNFNPLNDNNPVLTSDVGTQGTRDPFLIQSHIANQAWILATDLDINRSNWSASQIYGSTSIVLWHTRDLVHWADPYLLTLEDSNAGYVWAPSALWSEEDNIYYIFWSSRLYDTSDTDHNGPYRSVIRYTTTSDFRDIAPPQDYYYDPDSSTIDQDFIRLDDGEYARFLKDEKSKAIFQQKSNGGLFGDWTTVGKRKIRNAEGPTVFRDNIDANKYHLWVDRLGHVGYDAYDIDDIRLGQPVKSSALSPGDLRHGCVTPLTQEQYDRLKSSTVGMTLPSQLVVEQKRLK